MKVLVAGGAGYIGSHTVVQLHTAGHSCVIVDNLCNSHEKAVKRISKIVGENIKFYNIDLRNQERLEKVFQDNEFDAVIHFAGLKAVGESVDKPLLYYQNNLDSTLVLCDVMQKNDVKKLVFSSSATVYGDPDKIPISENSPVQPTNPYGQTKAMIEQILTDLAVSDSSWSVSLLRYFNPVGAHKSGLIGEDPSGIPNNLVPYISQVAIGKLRALNVYGNDYDTVDGTGVRDYIHITDLSDGHVKAIEKIKPGVSVYNLGTGRGTSVLEMVKAFEQASNKSIPVSITPRRPGDIAVCYADPAKAKQELDWTAKFTIKDMCEDTWRWQSQNPNGYKS